MHCNLGATVTNPTDTTSYDTTIEEDCQLMSSKITSVMCKWYFLTSFILVSKLPHDVIAFKLFSGDTHRSQCSGNDVLDVLCKEEHEAPPGTVLTQLWRPEYARSVAPSSEPHVHLTACPGT